MDTRFSISINLPLRDAKQPALDRETFPHLSAAVRRVGQEAHQRWVAYAAGAPLSDGKTIHDRTGTYLRSIQFTMTGDFSALVYSKLPYAQAIETGVPARDMKVMLSSSLKVRVSKEGFRYLIIPFRWNVPNSVQGHSMPQAVHNWWTGGAHEDSRITGSFKRLSGTGAMDIKTKKRLTVPGWKYHWGTRLTEDDMSGMKLGEKQAKRMAGMVRFRNPKPESAGHNTQYLTFRVMSEKSSGWMMPAQPGRYPARTVANQMKRVAEEEFRDAVEQDIREYLANALG